MSRLSADSWLPLANFLQTCCPWSWPSMWPPEDHSDNERKYGHERRKAGGSGLLLQVPPPPPASLTGTLHLSAGSPQCSL